MNKTLLKKLTMGAIILLIAGFIVAVDAFAWLCGATATISQVWLTVNRKCWALTYVLAILMGVLLEHVSVARDPKNGLDPPFWPQALMWLVAVLFGLWLYHVLPFLSQRPTVD